MRPKEVLTKVHLFLVAVLEETKHKKLY